MQVYGKQFLPRDHTNRIQKTMTKRIFVSADHGMAIIYFLQSDVLPTLINAGVEIIVLTDDDTKDRIAQRFARLGAGKSKICIAGSNN
jgi:hypothetical protein